MIPTAEGIDDCEVLGSVKVAVKERVLILLAAFPPLFFTYENMIIVLCIYLVFFCIFCFVLLSLLLATPVTTFRKKRAERVTC